MLPGRGRRLAVRAEAAGGGRHADRAQPDLAPRHVRARPRAVRASACRSARSTRSASAAQPRSQSRTKRWSRRSLGSPAVNVDETGWITAGMTRTLWTATTPEAAIFRIAEDRHRDRLEELLGNDFAGICCSDRWWAYDHIDPESRQACWSHLQRDFRRPRRRAPRPRSSSASKGSSSPSRLFQAWHDYHEHQDRARLNRRNGADPDRAPRARRSKPDAKPQEQVPPPASPTTS